MSEIFLSYARIDDEIPPAAGDRLGWVKFFYETLWYELKQRVSKDLHFWRDVNDIEPDGVFARDLPMEHEGDDEADDRYRDEASETRHS